MSGNDGARDFLEALTGYSEAPGDRIPSQDRPVKLATVDAAYTGTGYPKVLFDGESLMGLQTYVWTGRQPRAGERVVMLPQGRGYVIVGSVATMPGADMPVGTSIEGYWSAAPLGFALEDGTVYLRATYPALFTAIGTTYNTGGETASQFRVPDSRGRAQVGKSAAGTFATLGATGGAETVTLSVAEIPSHSHGLSLSGGTITTDWNLSNTAGSFYGDIATGSTGGGGAHNNLQPFIVVNRAIKY